MEAVINALLAYSDWLFANLDVAIRIFGALLLSAVGFAAIAFFVGWGIEALAESILFASVKSDGDAGDA